NDLVALLQAVALLCLASVDAQLPLPQEPEQQPGRDTFEAGAQELVQPSAGMLAVDDDRPGGSAVHSLWGRRAAHLGLGLAPRPRGRCRLGHRSLRPVRADRYDVSLRKRPSCIAWRRASSGPRCTA